MSGKSYVDRQGRVYAVLRIMYCGEIRPFYRAYRQAGGEYNFEWDPLKSLPARDTFADAQADLDAFADALLMEEYKE